MTITPQINLEDMIIVPRLHGKSLAEAIEMIEEAGLEVGEITYETHNSAPAEQVIRQDPPVGSFVKKGQAVTPVSYTHLTLPTKRIV